MRPETEAKIDGCVALFFFVLFAAMLAWCTAGCDPAFCALDGGALDAAAEMSDAQAPDASAVADAPVDAFVWEACDPKVDHDWCVIDAGSAAPDGDR